MKKNMDLPDKIIRIMIAAVTIILYYSNVIPGTIAFMLLIFAEILVTTSLPGFCQLYLPLGIWTISTSGKTNTCTK